MCTSAEHEEEEGQSAGRTSPVTTCLLASKVYALGEGGHPPTHSESDTGDLLS